MVLRAAVLSKLEMDLSRERRRIDFYSDNKVTCGLCLTGVMKPSIEDAVLVEAT